MSHFTATGSLIEVSIACLHLQDGRTPLMLAAYAGSALTVQALLRAGAALNLVDNVSKRRGDAVSAVTLYCATCVSGRVLVYVHQHRVFIVHCSL
jgi:hypothetical protein